MHTSRNAQHHCEVVVPIDDLPMPSVDDPPVGESTRGAALVSFDLVLL